MSESSHSIINRILKEQNINYDPQSGVVQKLNEFMANYTLKILKQAKQRSVHLKKETITYQDIKQIIQNNQEKKQYLDITDQEIISRNKDNKIGPAIRLIEKERQGRHFGGVILPNKKESWNLSTNQYLDLNIYEKQQLKDKLQYNLYQSLKEEINANQQLQNQIEIEQPVQEKRALQRNFDDDDEDFEDDEDEDDEQNQNRQQQQMQQQQKDNQQFQQQQQQQQNQQVSSYGQNKPNRKFKFNILGLVEVEDENDINQDPYKKIQFQTD